MENTNEIHSLLGEIQKFTYDLSKTSHEYESNLAKLDHNISVFTDKLSRLKKVAKNYRESLSPWIQQKDIAANLARVVARRSRHTIVKISWAYIKKCLTEDIKNYLSNDTTLKEANINFKVSDVDIIVNTSEDLPDCYKVPLDYALIKINGELTHTDNLFDLTPLTLLVTVRVALRNKIKPTVVPTIPSELKYLDLYSNDLALTTVLTRRVHIDSPISPTSSIRKLLRRSLDNIFSNQLTSASFSSGFKLPFQPIGDSVNGPYAIHEAYFSFLFAEMLDKNCVISGRIFSDCYGIEDMTSDFRPITVFSPLRNRINLNKQEAHPSIDRPDWADIGLYINTSFLGNVMGSELVRNMFILKINNPDVKLVGILNDDRLPSRNENIFKWDATFTATYVPEFCNTYKLECYNWKCVYVCSAVTKSFFWVGSTSAYGEFIIEEVLGNKILYFLISFPNTPIANRKFEIPLGRNVELIDYKIENDYVSIFAKYYK